MVKLKSVRVCHVKTILIVQVDVALQQWQMEALLAMLLSRVVFAHELLLLKSIMHYTRSTRLTSVSIKILLKRSASRNLIILTTCPFIGVKEAAMFMALKISVMDSHAMTMMTVSVVAVDILSHFSSKDVSHLLRMIFAHDSLNQLIDHQFLHNFLQSSQPSKTCTIFKIEYTMLSLMAMIMQ